MTIENINDRRVKHPTLNGLNGPQTYVFDVEETLVATVSVEALNLAEAERIVEGLRDGGELPFKTIYSGVDFIRMSDEEEPDYQLPPESKTVAR